MNAWWYILNAGLSRASFPTQRAALAALKKARAFYDERGGYVIEATSDADAVRQCKAHVKRIGRAER